MVAGAEIAETPGFGEPSLFWQALAREHSDSLERDGTALIKRRQALRYFTWRWRWAALHESRQLRFLLSRSSPATTLRCATARADLSSAAWHDVPWTRRERWLYVFAVRLLWEYARQHDTLDVLSHPEPQLGSPLPVEWSGRPISQDLANGALEAAAIARALDGTRPQSIVEVGAGYGRTAYALLNAFPEAMYAIVDIEPALSISRWYLTSLFPAERLRFFEPHETSRLDADVDLVVSISSLQEMRRDQVAGYLNLFDRVTRGVVYLKQWERWTNDADGVTLAFDDYPIPERWICVLDEPAQVQTNFRQAAWRVPVLV
jgi:putative sugar O-methyltransferase